MATVSADIATRFEIGNTLGQAKDLTDGKAVALKVVNAGKGGSESKVLQKLVHKGLPRVYQVIHNGYYDYISLELLGPSFFTLIRLHRSGLSLDSVVRSAYQLFKTFKYIHRCGYVHRDVKPDNILLGVGKHSHRTYLIDFSEARKYQCGKVSKALVGNPYFMSDRSLRGESAGPRDDLESLMYSLIFCLTSTLPWMGIEELDFELLRKKVLSKRSELSLDQLFPDLPSEFREIYTHVRGLNQTEVPDYHLILGKIKALAHRTSIKLNEKPKLLPRFSSAQRCSATLASGDKIHKFRTSSARVIATGTPRLEAFSDLPTTNQSTSSAGSEQNSPHFIEDIPTLVSERLPELSSKVKRVLKRRG